MASQSAANWPRPTDYCRGAASVGGEERRPRCQRLVRTRRLDPHQGWAACRCRGSAGLPFEDLTSSAFAGADHPAASTAHLALRLQAPEDPDQPTAPEELRRSGKSRITLWSDGASIEAMCGSSIESN
jgi:hypothetical protein